MMTGWFLFVVLHERVNGECYVTTDIEEAVTVAFNHRGNVRLSSFPLINVGPRNALFTRTQTTRKSEIGLGTVSSSQRLVLAVSRYASPVMAPPKSRGGRVWSSVIDNEKTKDGG